MPTCRLAHSVRKFMKSLIQWNFHNVGFLSFKYGSMLFWKSAHLKLSQMRHSNPDPQSTDHIWKFRHFPLPLCFWIWVEVEGLELEPLISQVHTGCQIWVPESHSQFYFIPNINWVTLQPCQSLLCVYTLCKWSSINHVNCLLSQTN